MNLIEICQAAMDEIGFDRPSAIVSSTDPDARQLFALANREGKLLSEKKAWSSLVKEHSVALVNGQQAYDWPSDFGWMIPETLWDRDNKRQGIGPMTPEEWQFLKGWTTISGLNRRFRIFNNQLLFDQAIGPGDAGKTVVFEYVSKYWAKDSASTPKLRFTADTDLHCLDDDLLIMGIKWRFQKAKGFDWKEDYQEYISLFNKHIARDGSTRKLRLGNALSYSIGVNIPDQNFG